MWNLSYLHYLLKPLQQCSLIVNVGNKTTESTVPVTDTITTNNKSQIFSCHIRVVADIEKHPGHSLLFKTVVAILSAVQRQEDQGNLTPENQGQEVASSGT